MQLAEVIHAVGSALQAWLAEPVPRERGEELAGRIQVIRKAMSLVMEALPNFPLDRVAEVEAQLVKADDRVAYIVLPRDLPERLQNALRGVLVVLLARGEAEQAKQDAIRKAVATIALPAESELKKLVRYRKALEDGLQRRLQALDLMRKLTADHAAPPDAEKAREFRVRLRLVR